MLPFAFTSSLLPIVIPIVIYGLLAWYAYRHRTTTGARSFAFLLLALFQWSACYTLELAGTNFPTKSFWAIITYLGIVSTPVFWLVFALEYTGRKAWINPARLMSLFVIPVMTMIVISTNDGHRLFWASRELAAEGQYLIIATTNGIWFWTHAVYSYVLLLIGVTLLARTLLRWPAQYRGQMVAVLVSMTPPWITNVVTIFDLVPARIDMTPFAFTFSGIGLAYALFRHRMLDLSPIAREVVIDGIKDGMFVLDVARRIVDINPAARRMLGLDGAYQPIGKPLAEVLARWPDLVERYRDMVEGQEEINVDIGASRLWYELNFSALRDEQQRLIGQVIIVRNITDRKRADEQIRLQAVALNSAANAIIITDTQGLIQWVNPAFTNLTGYAAAEVIGKSPNLLKSGKHAKEFYQNMWGTLKAGAVWQGEFMNRRKDGSLFWDQSTIAPVQNQVGETTHFVAIKEDISKQKQLQEQLERQNGYLSVLHQLTLDLLNRRNLFDILQAIVNHAANLLDAPFGEIMLEKDGQLVVQAFTPNLSSHKGDLVIRESNLLSWQAFDTRQPALIDDYATWEYRQKSYETNVLRAVADFPVLAGEKCIGVLSVGRSKPGYIFTPEQIQSGTLFARLAALVLDNANLYNAAMQEIAERKQAQNLMLSFLNDMQALQQVHLALSEVTGLKELYSQIIILSQQQLGFDRLGLFIVDEANNELVGTYGVDGKGNVYDVRDYREAITPKHWTAEVLDSLQYAKVWEDVPLMDGAEIAGTGWKVASTLWNGKKAIGYIVGDNLITHRPLRPYELELISLLGSIYGHLIERKWAESDLQESEARFRQIVENASDIIYRTDAQGRFIYVNPTAIYTAGLGTEAEMLGRHFLETAHPEWRKRLERFYSVQFARQQSSTYYEFPIVNYRSGQEIWLGQNVQLIKEGDKVVGFQAVARDITRLRQAQDALALSRDQALEASRLKSQLLAKVSHELRTPLGGIIGYAGLLHIDAFGALNDEQKNAAEQIIESADYLDKMINELLDQAQIEARTIILRKDTFSPVTLLQKVEANMTVLAKSKDLSLVTSIAGDVPEKLLGDERRLQQILINLTGNAIKYTKAGLVTVSITRPDPSHWAIKVSDTGAGIPKEAQSYIFEPFRQVDNSITRENRGTGLGLSITKQLVELMDGKICVESEVGLGSTFTVTLPILN